MFTELFLSPKYCILMVWTSYAWVINQQVACEIQAVTEVQHTLLLSSSTKNWAAVLRRESISTWAISSDYLTLQVRKALKNL
jgi:hypothetical protein